LKHGSNFNEPLGSKRLAEDLHDTKLVTNEPIGSVMGTGFHGAGALAGQNKGDLLKKDMYYGGSGMGTTDLRKNIELVEG